jgi:hypothetical protein
VFAVVLVEVRVFLMSVSVFRAVSHLFWAMIAVVLAEVHVFLMSVDIH